MKRPSKISIAVDKEINDNLESNSYNKSKLINTLLDKWLKSDKKNVNKFTKKQDFSYFHDIYNKRNIMRKRMTESEKKQKISITITPEINEQLEDLRVNKSKLINWLLQEHFNQLNLKYKN